VIALILIFLLVWGLCAFTHLCGYKTQFTTTFLGNLHRSFGGKTEPRDTGSETEHDDVAPEPAVGLDAVAFNDIV
jgi:hypothetical protein